MIIAVIIYEIFLHDGINMNSSICNFRKILTSEIWCVKTAKHMKIKKVITYRNIETCQNLGQRKTKAVIVFQLQVPPPPSAERIHDCRTVHHASVHKPNNRKLEIVDRTAYRCRSTQCTYACFREGKFCVHFILFLYCCKCFYYYFYLVSKIALNSLKGKYNYNHKS